MKNAFPTLAALALTGISPLLAADSSGWVSLYNGRDLSGWMQHGGKALYRAEGPDVVGTAVPKTENSFLCTVRHYTNFILELEFKPMEGLNSGVQIRSEVFDQEKTVMLDGQPKKIPAGRVHGYQVEIDPSPRAYSGGVYDEARRGWLADLKDNEPARKAFKAGEWNQFRIECRGDSIRTFLNGVKAADFRDSMTPSGLIALQVHGVGNKTNHLEVRWRNIRIQELP